MPAPVTPPRRRSGLALRGRHPTSSPPGKPRAATQVAPASGDDLLRIPSLPSAPPSEPEETREEEEEEEEEEEVVVPSSPPPPSPPPRLSPRSFFARQLTLHPSLHRSKIAWALCRSGANQPLAAAVLAAHVRGDPTPELAWSEEEDRVLLGTDAVEIQRVVEERERRVGGRGMGWEQRVQFLEAWEKAPRKRR